MSVPSLDLKLYIAGEWLDARGRQTEEVINPATGLSLGQLPHASAADLDTALESSEAAFLKWRAMSALERGQILRTAAGLLRQRQHHIATIMSLEQGKTLAESMLEVLISAEVFEWSAEEGRRAYGRVVPGRFPGWRNTVLRQPIGVTAAFTPWNFPALIPARKITGALGAGCTCIIKAAEETPACTIELARALHDAGLPPGVLNVVFGVPATVSEHLISSPVVRKVSFTGSVAVGRHIAGLAAQGVKPATLELGGHAPVLVFDDVDVQRVARAAVAGKYRNAGQVCVSPTRFFVHEKIYREFAAAFSDAAGSLRLGSGLDPQTGMGPLANPRRVAAMESLVEDARAGGAKVSAGGAPGGSEGFFYKPTVLTDIDPGARVMSEEPFGPLALIIPFASEEQAIAQANALPFGLAAYAFTSNADRITRLADHIESGMLGINTFLIASAETPFGGVKDSGYGAEGGTEGLDAYLTSKYVAQAPAA
ncbi:NAD-dependent succinate-semialdehyde dehydrogenase [Massilia cavernae]|uniref:NAD-dependent succinate-semialdehyde dehydrogenase n=1 Tax=Massilia cavernae TaxID=2320864 RepID=A0A418Y5K4_9BURK|nr:NAD-dependent succinate-semialdehyde dehydrogenase [Massilia cavernae]RJG22061.1 NAD-dependent succinate-semialdehyde dehydrogenase [Massilia cavernae]